MIQTSRVAKTPDRYQLRGTQITFTRKVQIATGCLALALFLLHFATPLIWLTDAVILWMIISPKVPSGIKGALAGCDYAYDNGGQPAGYPPGAKDCTIRAASIVTRRPYLQVRAELNTPVGQGVPRENQRTYLNWLGFTYHEATGPIPMTGRIIADVHSGAQKHTVAVVDNVIHDNVDTRGWDLIGYWTAS